MKNFFKKIIQLFVFISILFNIIKKIILNILWILIIVFITLLWIYSKKKCFNTKENNSYKNNALIIQLNKNIEENEISNKYNKKNYYNLLNNKYNKKKSVFEIVKKIRQAKKDSKITGLILKIYNNFTADPVVLEYIGKALNEFKKSGKLIYALGKNYTQNQYYLASFANKIFLFPHGSIKLYGFDNQQLYFKKFLDICKIHVHIFRIGKYKSAVEPFLYNYPSNSNKVINSSWIKQRWKYFLEKIAKNRKTTKKDIFPEPQKIINELKNNHNNTEKFALKHHLIDKIDTYFKIKRYLIKKFGLNKENRNFNAINIQNYFFKKKKYSNLKNKIAIILINGIIENNKNNINNINVKMIYNQIKYAKCNPKIKAIVLRINSPGGNSIISENIRKKLYEINNNHKPIIISMSNIAASGGYWISMAGNYIIANSITITGSIGIFSIIQTFEKTLEMLGIYNNNINILPLNNFNLYNNLTYENKKLIRINIRNGYEKFIKMVSVARHKTPKYINHISQGKIWLGEDAKKLGLIDNVGDFDFAIIKAAKLAKLKKYEIFWFTKNNNFYQAFKNIFYNKINYSCKKILFTFVPLVIIKKIFYILNVMNIINNNTGNYRYAAFLDTI